MGLFFGKINLISPISNLLVLMTVQLISVMGFLGSVVGVFVPVLGKLVLWFVWPLLKYFGLVAQMIGGWWWVNVAVGFNILIVFGWYLILISVLFKFNSTTIFYRACNHRNSRSEASPSKKHCLH